MLKKHRKVYFAFPTRSRFERFDQVGAGNSPKEFYYGFFHLQDCGIPVEMLDTRGNIAGNVLCRVSQLIEYASNRLCNVSFNRNLAAQYLDAISPDDLIISFIDWFSLSLGLENAKRGNKFKIAGGFHGLSDLLLPNNKIISRKYLEHFCKNAIYGLSMAFFFGDIDRRAAVTKYELERINTRLFRFGVDTEFWMSSENSSVHDFSLLSVGSDRWRNYQLLLDAAGNTPLEIITSASISKRNKLGRVPSARVGSFHDPSLTDMELREAYQKASAIVVPLHDTTQPSGYSVTLQAMACGKPVILTNIEGLWDREVFRDKENCLLVPPNDKTSLRNAIESIKSNRGLASRLGLNARLAAVKHFGIRRMNTDILDIVESLAQRSQK